VFVINVRIAALLVLAIAPKFGFSEDRIDFNRQIRPLLSSRCIACHGPDEDERAADLRLDILQGAHADRGGYAAVVAGKPATSELYRRLVSEDDEEVMPPSGKGERLSKEEISLIEKWIAQGGNYEKHWSYVTPSKSTPPAVNDTTWSINELDRFILARLEKEGLTPAPQANRRTLARRVALDLTGLPPTIPEVDSFVNDVQPEAYERFVDSMLNKPAFGEHWARRWLDQARYADSSGYPSDQPRVIWRYRDWVIQALNRNLPFDKFTIEQLAGDLLPEPTEEQLIATAFHRNTMTQNEGGTSDEEFRVAAVVDRTNTSLEVWMGTTMACAQCHTHKFDPITQQEYFQVFAIFNQSEDSDRKDESPLLEIVSPAETQLRTEIDEQLKDLTSVMPLTEDMSKRVDDLKKKREQIKPVTVPVMRELSEKERRITKIQRRGNWLDLGNEVQPAVPAAFLTSESSGRLDRLGFAKWIASSENPLTARVAVNRFWESIFGVGIVQTSEDFGSQGDLPFHPELLDWIAADFMEHGWDVKRLLKQFVSTQAYRQESRSTAELNERDPDNRLLARSPRFRPTGEQLRDQALFVSGLLSEGVGGVPVRPLAPNMGLSVAFGHSNDWKTSEGASRHRRSVYTEVQRNSPYASFATFDAPNRETCTIRRNRTNTPLQAFVTLNDPVFIEANQAMARRLASDLSEASTEGKISYAFQLCVSREPSKDELKVLSDLFDETYSGLTNDPEAATKLATEPLGPTPAGANVTELAAWTVITNVIMNLDEFLMRQ